MSNMLLYFPIFITVSIQCFFRLSAGIRMYQSVPEEPSLCNATLQYRTHYPQETDVQPDLAKRKRKPENPAMAIDLVKLVIYDGKHRDSIGFHLRFGFKKHDHKNVVAQKVAYE